MITCSCLVLGDEMIMKHASGASLQNSTVYGGLHTHSSMLDVDLLGYGGELISGVITFVSVVGIAYLIWKCAHCGVHLKGMHKAWRNHHNTTKEENLNNCRRSRRNGIHF